MTLISVAGAWDRWLLFAAALVATGAAAFRVLVLGRIDAPSAQDAQEAQARRAATIGMAASLVVLVAALGRLPLQVAELSDPEMPLGPQARALMLHTLWGKAWAWQLALAVLTAVTFARARRGSARAWALAAVCAVGLAFTPAFSGHAIGSERLPALAVLADGLHVLGAGMWLGAMLVLFAGLAREGAPAAQRLVPAFSPLALGAASLVAATGLLSAWLHLGSLPPLWRSRYGRTLLVKLSGVAIMAGAGAYNWRRAGPALQRSAQVGPIRRSIGAELVVAALVILATAMLVVTPPPGEE